MTNTKLTILQINETHGYLEPHVTHEIRNILNTALLAFDASIASAIGSTRVA